MRPQTTNCSFGLQFCTPDFSDPAPTAKDLSIDFNTFIKRVHIRTEDVLVVLRKLGFLDNRVSQADKLEIRVSLDVVLRACERWKVYACGMIQQDAIDRATRRSLRF